MSLAATFRPLATRLLRTLSGKQVTYKRVTQGAYDAATSSATPVETESTVYAYAGTPNLLALFKNVEGATGTMYLSAEQLGFMPSTGDFIVDGALEYRVLAVTAYSAGTADALYLVATGRG